MVGVQVLVEEGVNQVVYTLDEGLIEFGTAIEDGDLLRYYCDPGCVTIAPLLHRFPIHHCFVC